MCNFWINVKKMLPYKDLEVKDLAFRAGIPYSTIINGMNKNSMPHADIAVKISKILNVSLETLLGTECTKIHEGVMYSQSEMEEREKKLYLKNKVIIDALEEVPVSMNNAIKELILSAKENYSSK